MGKKFINDVKDNLEWLSEEEREEAISLIDDIGYKLLNILPHNKIRVEYSVYGNERAIRFVVRGVDIKKELEDLGHVDRRGVWLGTEEAERYKERIYKVTEMSCFSDVVGYINDRREYTIYMYKGILKRLVEREVDELKKYGIYIIEL